jgi:hypothetical protein
VMRVSRIDELEESKEIDPDGYELIHSDGFSSAIAGRVFASNLQGLIFVADDQHINLEIIKQHMHALEMEKECRYFINGQQVIDAVAKVVRETLIRSSINQEFNR